MPFLAIIQLFYFSLSSLTAEWNDTLAGLILPDSLARPKRLTQGETQIPEVVVSLTSQIALSAFPWPVPEGTGSASENGMVKKLLCCSGMSSLKIPLFDLWFGKIPPWCLPSTLWEWQRGNP